ncbi:MAG: ArsR/SmtB family transcription factor [Promethearchaeota archaeon]
MGEKVDSSVIEKLEALYETSDVSAKVQHLQQIRPAFIKNPLNAQMLQMFKSFSGNSESGRERFSILYLLTQHEYSVSELQEIIQKPQPTISRHLKLLEQAHLIRALKKGKRSYYKPLKASLKLIEKFMTAWINSIDNWFAFDA